MDSGIISSAFRGVHLLCKQDRHAVFSLIWLYPVPAVRFYVGVERAASTEAKRLVDRKMMTVRPRLLVLREPTSSR